MLIDEIKVEEAFEKYNKLFYNSPMYYRLKDMEGDLGIAKHDFKAGVEFAESQIEDVCIEFVIFCDDNFEEGNTNFKQLFQQFLKEREE